MTTFSRNQLLPAVILLFVCSAAHCAPQSEESIIAEVKQTNVSSIDPRLEPMLYAAWLQRTLGSSATIQWEVDDCGEGANSKGTWPLCVTAIGKFHEQGEVLVSLAVGHSEIGILGKPTVMNIYVEGVGPSRSFSNLHQLPEYLEQQSKRKNVTAQFTDKPLDETTAVNFAKNIDVHSLLPEEQSQTLSHWLAVLAGPDAISWKLDGCDQVAISMRLSEHRDYRACVYARFENKNESVLVSIEVGTYRTGLATLPKVALTQVYNKRRASIGITSPPLGELPRKLADLRQKDSH